MNTETLDKLYLEWSQFTKATTAREAKMIESLELCAEYFDNKADSDYDQDGPVHNREMMILSSIKHALE
jgi:hypothetical protein